MAGAPARRRVVEPQLAHCGSERIWTDAEPGKLSHRDRRFVENVDSFGECMSRPYFLAGHRHLGANFSPE